MTPSAPRSGSPTAPAFPATPPSGTPSTPQRPTLSSTASAPPALSPPASAPRARSSACCCSRPIPRQGSPSPLRPNDHGGRHRYGLGVRPREDPPAIVAASALYPQIEREFLAITS